MQYTLAKENHITASISRKPGLQVGAVWHTAYSQSLSHDHTVYERRKERLGNVPFCI